MLLKCSLLISHVFGTRAYVFITCLVYLKIRTILPKIKQIKIDRILCENAKAHEYTIIYPFDSLLAETLLHWRRTQHTKDQDKT